MTPTDWRELCAELLTCNRSGLYDDDLVLRARAALAQPEPALPQRPECFEFALDFLGYPENDQLREYIERLEARAALAKPVADGPTNEELLEMWHGSDWYDEGATIREFRSIARAVLARYGHQPPPPAEGEVADETRYLVKELRDQADDLSPSLELFGLIHRAADLLEQRHPAPVPVAERLPGAEDCDGEGFCWWFSPADPSIGTFGVAACWVLRRPEPDDDFRTHWLPATALPLPAGEVE